MLIYIKYTIFFSFFYLRFTFFASTQDHPIHNLEMIL